LISFNTVQKILFVIDEICRGLIAKYYLKYRTFAKILHNIKSEMFLQSVEDAEEIGKSIVISTRLIFIKTDLH